jgi:chloramphenicol 3-O-phosphotransferase
LNCTAESTPPVIVIGGAPGSGKSTLARGLRAAFPSPWVDFGRLRAFHLRPDWSDQSPAEELLTFENLIAILGNYARHGYRNVLVDDLRDERIRQIPDALAGIDFRIITLTLSDENELRTRIVERNDGWRNCDAAVVWNRQVIDRPAVVRESKIDTSAQSVAAVLADALALLSK